MLDVRDARTVFSVSRKRPVRIVPVVGRISEGIDLQMLENLLGHLGQEPVNYETSLNAPLTVHNEDNLVKLRIQKGFLDVGVRVSDVLGRVGKVSLDQTLNQIEYDTIPAVNRVEMSTLAWIPHTKKKGGNGPTLD